MDFYNEIGFIHDAMMKVSSTLIETKDVAEIVVLSDLQMELAKTSCSIKLMEEPLSEEEYAKLMEYLDENPDEK